MVPVVVLEFESEVALVSAESADSESPDFEESEEVDFAVGAVEF